MGSPSGNERIQFGSKTTGRSFVRGSIAQEKEDKEEEEAVVAKNVPIDPKTLIATIFARRDME